MTGVEHFTLGERSGRAIHVGLVNNMPDAALRATELQFARLLKDAAGGLDVRLQLFSLSSIARGEQALSRMQGFYEDAETLPLAGLDALIVTGAEPQADDLRDEPYWPQLAHLIDWAEIGTVSTLFSCLAAHAAVLHLDGIARHPLAAKLSGVFACERVAEDPLFFQMRAVTGMPHSRRNEIRESDLVAKKYRILSRLAGGGVDMFSRMSGNSQFLFFQGHPEYDSASLGREYLRDMGRFLRGEGARPALPQHYFDRATEDRLSALAHGALTNGARDESALGNLAAVVAGARPLQAWQAPTVRLFANWLTLVAAAKGRRRPATATPDRTRLRA